ncbi:MAG: hypothetical protein KTR33_02825 [Gammaproteobacteria bacterium]|nr:hypothetical protein [Gammaproteobacteria bacterium]
MHAITKAANLLQISEYRILSEAYLFTYGDRPDEEEISELFSRAMMFGDIPDWAEKFAHGVVTDFTANRKVNLNTYCLLNLSPRVGQKKIPVSFNIIG